MTNNRSIAPEGYKERDDVIEGTDETRDQLYEVGVPQLVLQMDMNDRNEWEKLPMQYYTGCILDCEYQFDKYAHRADHGFLQAGDFKNFLERFRSKTTAPDWVVICFCGHRQVESFLQVASEFCHGNAERMFWVKPATSGNLLKSSENMYKQVSMDLDTPQKYPNAVEMFIVCSYVSEGVATGPQPLIFCMLSVDAWKCQCFCA